LTGKVVAFGVEVVFGLLKNVGFGERETLFAGDGGGEGFGGTEFEGSEGDDDVELFIEDVVGFDGFFDEAVVFANLVFEEFGGLAGFLLLDETEIVRDVLALRVNNDLDGVGEGVKDGGIGVDSGFLFGFGEEVEVDGGGGHDQTSGAVFENNDVVEDILDIQMLLGGGFDGNGRHGI
jgi:hypothetical protein